MIEIKRKSQQAKITPAESAQKPQDGANRQQAGLITPSNEQALKRKIGAFTGASGANYQAMYAAAFEYHKQKSPPFIDHEYWKAHAPGVDKTPQSEQDFWANAVSEADAICKKFSNHRFVLDLMSSVFAEIERTYKAERERAAKGEGSREKSG